MESYIKRINLFKKTTRKIVSRFYPRVVILLYHRVFKADSDPQLLCVTPKNFTDQMDYLKSHYQIIGLQKLAHALKHKKTHKPAVVLTFDDGYSDIFFNAKPILERYEIPATTFIATDYISQLREFWWDDLERILLLTEELPSTLSLMIKGKAYFWELSSSQRNDGGQDSYKKWDVTKKSCPSVRHEIYKQLHSLFVTLDQSSRLKALSELTKWASISNSGRSDYRALNTNESRVLSESGLMEIGSHGCTHSILAKQPTNIQRKEITESKNILEGILQRTISSFAYPFGTPKDIDGEMINLLQEAKYLTACANFPKSINKYSNPLLLGRFLVRDWDKKEFASRLRNFFNT